MVGPDDVAHQKEVTTGTEQGELVQITSGVQAGQRVIRVGQYELSDGAKVRPAGTAPKEGD